MQERNLFLIFVSKLERFNLKYIITGSVASIIYGEPRLTHDIDLVIELNDKNIQNIISAFPQDEFYCPPLEVIKLEAKRPYRGHFNIIHHESGFKADIYLSGKDELHHWAMANKRRYEVENVPIWLAPPEYVILRKLEYYREGKSEKHIFDIKNILEISNEQIDMNQLQTKISAYRLKKEWEIVLQR